MTSAASDPPPRRLLDRRSPPALATLVLMAGAGALSLNIFLPSMPAMAVYFSVDYAVIQLAVSAYIGVMGALQLVIGPLSDRYGRRPVILTSFAIFCVATVGCALAPTIEIFMACRLLQATVSAGMVMSRAIVRDMVGPEKSASMIGYVTMGMALVPMLGPVIGGAIEEFFGWRTNFYVLLGFGVLTLALIWADAGETNRSRSASFTDQFRAYPELFRSRRFWGYAFAAAFSSGAFFTFLGGAPFVASEVLGLTPSELGFYFGFIAAGYMMGNFISGRFAVKVGLNGMILLGTATGFAATVACLALFLLGAVHPVALFGPMFFVGLGNGTALPSAVSGTLSVRPHLAGSASGLGSTMMMGGGAAFSALTGWLLTLHGGAFPLLGMLVATTAASVLSVAYVFRIARRRGPLDEAHEG